MSNSPSIEVIPAIEPWAEIRAHNQVMRYRRHGAGRSLLLLDSPTAPEICAEMRDALAAGCRLIIPELPTENVPLAGWLADLLEGLGSSNVGVITAAHYCAAAIELALRGVDQIARVAIIYPDSSAHRCAPASTEQGELANVCCRTSVPILLLHRGQRLDEIVMLVRDFFHNE